MRIAVDARELCGHPTGVGRYLSGLLDAWTGEQMLARHQLTLIAHQAIENVSRWPVNVRIVPGNGGTLWEQTTLARVVAGEAAEVLFAPGYTAPLTVTTPLVLTIHDVSYFAHPEWFAAREGWRRRWLTRRAARRARRVITDTEFSRTEIARYVGVDATVIPLGIDRADGNVAAASDARAPMVLYVGSLFQRRRVDRLIAAFDRVADRVAGARLEIVGENRTRPRIDFESLVRNSQHAGRIRLRSYVDEATLHSLYAEASVFAFLSEYEGFGLTPLEALAQGVPPVLLDTAVARETCGNAARYVSPSASNDALADAIVELITNDSARSALLNERAAVFAQFDWRRTARTTMTVLEEAARA